MALIFSDRMVQALVRYFLTYRERIAYDPQPVGVGFGWPREAHNASLLIGGLRLSSKPMLGEPMHGLNVGFDLAVRSVAPLAGGSEYACIAWPGVPLPSLALPVVPC